MNFMWRNFITLLFVLGISLIVVPLYAQTQAGVLLFDPKASSTSVGDTFEVNINIDPRSDKVSGSDIFILYDPAFIEPQAVSPGTYFPIVSNTIKPGKIYISALVETSAQYQTGIGTIATVTFKANKVGTATLRFDCDLSREDGSTVVKSDVNGTNTIECSGLNTHTATIVGLAGSAGSSGTNGSGTSGTNGSADGSVAELPQSGVYDSVLKLSIPGITLLALGLILKVLLKV